MKIKRTNNNFYPVRDYSYKSKNQFTIVETTPQILNFDNTYNTSQAWVDLINSAQSNISIAAYYSSMFCVQTTEPCPVDGDLVISALHDAALRDIQIKMVIDSTSFYDDSEIQQLKDQIPTLEIQYINIDALFGGVQHSKFIIVDDKKFYLGSANFDWRALSLVKELGVIIEDKTITWDIITIFNEYWLLSTQDRYANVEKYDGKPEFTDQDLQPYFNQNNVFNNTGYFGISPPELVTQTRTHDIDGIIDIVNNAQNTLILETMDFSETTSFIHPKQFDDKLTPALINAALRGVQVTLMIQNTTSSSVLSQLQYLQSYNIKVYMMNMPQLDPQPTGFDHSYLTHSKFIAVDGTYGVITTSNFQPDYFIDTCGHNNLKVFLIEIQIVNIHIYMNDICFRQMTKVFTYDQVFQYTRNYHFQLPTDIVTKELVTLFNTDNDIEMKMLEIIGFELIETNLPQQLMELYNNPPKQSNSLVKQIYNQYQSNNYQVVKQSIEQNQIYSSNSNLFSISTFPRSSKPPPEVPLIETKTLPEQYQEAFNFDYFNAIQSSVFNAAYYNNDNLLVSAPTSSGKTNIALLTILQKLNQILKSEDKFDLFFSLKQYSERVELLKELKFKIIYLTPLKALAQEISTKFQNQLQQIGLKVCQITGDTKPSKQIWNDSHVLILTPQMFLLMTGSGNDDFNEQISLIIFDEIHLVGEKQTGPVYENILMRSLYYQQIHQKNIRLIGLSATIPNYKNFAQFLQVSNQNCFVFGSEFRAVQMDTSLVKVKLLSGKDINKLLASQPINDDQFIENNDQYNNFNKNNQIIKKLQPSQIEEVNNLVLQLQKYEEYMISKLQLNQKQNKLQDDINKHEKVKKTQLKQYKQNIQDTYDELSIQLTLHYIQQTNVLLFVNSRNKTVQLAQQISVQSQVKIFLTKQEQQVASTYEKGILLSCLQRGIGFHNASMSKPQRQLVEKLFVNGSLKCVVCTATLIIGINAPAQVVIVRGTQFVSDEGIQNIDINTLKQVIGRAGRPQFTKKGEIAQGIILTDEQNYQYYVNQFDSNVQIESQIYYNLENILIQEIKQGFISKISDAYDYFSNSFGYITKAIDNITIENAIIHLINAKMIQLQQREQYDQSFIIPTKLCNICAQSQVSYKVILQFLQQLNESVIGQVSKSQLLYWIASCEDLKQFGNIRKEEQNELKYLIGDFNEAIQTAKNKQMLNKLISRSNQQDNLCIPIIAADTEAAYKVSILIVCFIQRKQLKLQSLIADQRMIIQQLIRVLDAMEAFLILTKRGQEFIEFIELKNQIYYQITQNQYNCLMGFVIKPVGSYQKSYSREQYTISYQSQERKNNLIDISSIYSLLNYQNIKSTNLKKVKKIDLVNELGSASSDQIIAVQKNIPQINYYTNITVLNKQTLRIKFYGKPAFQHNKILFDQDIEFTILFQQDNGEIIKSFKLVINSDNIQDNINLSCLVHINQFKKPQIGKQQISYIQYVNGISDQPSIQLDSFSNLSEMQLTIISTNFPAIVQKEFINLNKIYYSDFNNFGYKELNQPSLLYQSQEQAYFTPIPKIHCLSTSITNHQELFNFKSFNPIQSIAYNKLYYSFDNCYIGASTSCGKTACAEIAMLQQLVYFDNTKIIYIAPLKAIVQEKVRDWKKYKQFTTVADLTGETLPDSQLLKKSRIICTTPEKFDAITRFESQHQYVNNIGLIVIDEIHLIGSSRGWIIENIVSRFKNREGIRIIGMSTATANGKDLMKFLNIKQNCFFNFDNKARPLNLLTKFMGFIGDSYCERMNIMNRPIYNLIQQYNRYGLPTLIFVASRKQTRLTGYALLSMRQHGKSSNNIINLINTIPDDNLAYGFEDKDLKQLIVYGIGIHHASLSKKDRDLVLELYIAGKIKLLIATATLAAGLNVPSYLTIVKGCEFYDKKICGYVDHDIITIQQMIGRAGRVQYVENKYYEMISMFISKDFADDLKIKGIFNGMYIYNKQLIIDNTPLITKVQLEMLDYIEKLDQQEPKAVAIVLAKEEMKEFYQQFMKESLPFESSMINSSYGNTLIAARDSINAHKGDSFLPICINAYICSNKQVSFKQIILDFLHNTFYFLRCRKNPTLYGIDVDEIIYKLENITTLELGYFQEAFNLYSPTTLITSVEKQNLVDFFICYQNYLRIQDILQFLQENNYIQIENNLSKGQLQINEIITAQPLCEIASMYFLKIDTLKYMKEQYIDIEKSNFIEVLSFSKEFYEIPVRKEEDFHMFNLFNKYKLPKLKNYQQVNQLLNQYVKTYFCYEAQINMDRIIKQQKSQEVFPTPEFQLDLNYLLSNITRYCSAIISECIFYQTDYEKVQSIQQFLQNIVTGGNLQIVQKFKPIIKYIIKCQNTQNKLNCSITLQVSNKISNFVSTQYYQNQKSRTFYVFLLINNKICYSQKINHMLTKEQIIFNQIPYDQDNKYAIAISNDIFNYLDKVIQINIQNNSFEYTKQFQ